MDNALDLPSTDGGFYSHLVSADFFDDDAVFYELLQSRLGLLPNNFGMLFIYCKHLVAMAVRDGIYWNLNETFHLLLRFSGIIFLRDHEFLRRIVYA